MRTLLCLVFVFACTHAAAATPLERSQAQQLKYEVAGEYRLETGRSVRLSLVDQQLYIDLNKRYRRALHSVRPNLLALRDGALTVRYILDGPAERILIRHERFSSKRRIGEERWVGRQVRGTLRRPPPASSAAVRQGAAPFSFPRAVIARLTA